ncbi:MAG: hypothetical protein ABI618_12440, partial [Nitrospirota bacterium]
VSTDPRPISHLDLNAQKDKTDYHPYSKRRSRVHLLVGHFMDASYYRSPDQLIKEGQSPILDIPYKDLVS